MKLQTDEALALGIQRGSKQDLGELIRRHHPLLVGYLYRLTGGDRALAEDLAQETFLRLMRSIGQYQHPRPFKPWLYALATNLARDHYKRADTRHTWTVLDDEAHGLDQLAGDDQPDAALLADDETHEVARALARLPDFQREVVILRYYQNLSHAEIAEALHIPTGTVKSRLANGIKRLRDLLDNDAGIISEADERPDVEPDRRVLRPPNEPLPTETLPAIITRPA